MVDTERKEPGVSSSVEIRATSTAHSVRNIDVAYDKSPGFTLNDPNLPEPFSQTLTDKCSTVDAICLGPEAAVFEDSPYEEVRAAVHPTDDPELPVNTIRVWCLGMFFVTLGSGLNMLFGMRNPSLVISSIMAQLLSYWAGKGWERIFPDREFQIAGRTFNLNPGKFNIKEHTVITIMSNVSFGGGQAYATNIIISQQHYYGQYLGWIYQILLVWSSQMIGYGIAGVARKYLVWPASMIWPSTLVNTALFHTLHQDHEPSVSSWYVTRFRFFLYVLAGSFVWYFFPGYIAPFLSVFAIVTWIKPNNVVVNQLFGGFTGLSILPITFDWTQVAGYVGSPLAYPAHAIANIFAGTVIMFILVTSVVHYSGAWYSEFLPISDSTSYDNTQAVYNVTKILTPEFTLDVAKYQEYSPLFLSTTFALCYGISFATIASVISHTILYNGKELWARFKSTTKGDDNDIHMRLMRRYPEVPNWWYAAMFVVTVVMSLVVTQVYETHLKWWSFVLAIFISLAWFLPVGVIQASTNIQVGLNVITEFIIGYMQPGSPVAMMCFKTYGYITMSQGLSFASDLKIGHYMKIPPRTLFWTQVAATVWGSLVEVAVMNWALGSIKDVCTKHAADGFSCPGARVFYTASVIWGLLGPARIFSIGQIYDKLLWFFLLGILAPVPFWYMAKRRPQSLWRYVNIPVFFGGTGLIPPATPLNYLSFSIIGWIFNSRIKNRYPQWWSKYNYVLSAALDSGLAIATVTIFLTLSLTGINGGSFPSWWGVDVVGTTMDAQGTAIKTVLAEGQTFGPKVW